MSISPGTRFGPYEIQAELGAGGMGVVYRARDTKLGREVAIKVLLPSVAHDSDRLARFEREGRLLAALNHPHIAAIFGLENSGGAAGLVLELVDGPTLADRLGAGPLPVTEALTIARQIADAIDAAHEKGIVHRDLKPANIKVRPDGMVKVLDFGLAKATAGNVGGPDLTQSLTVTVGNTREGVILGTLAYLSPEQARGKPVDKRADIWAFGCVLYEMLTGRAAFAGETMSDTIAATLGADPPWTALPESTPAVVRRLLAQCLEKDPKRRLRDIGHARIELDDALAASAVGARSAPSVAASSLKRRVLAASILVAAVLLLLIIAGSGMRDHASGVVARIADLLNLPPASSRATIGSIAVLPLQNLSGDPEQDYFAAGMTDALITSLAKLRTVRVSSRTSVMQFRAGTRTLPDIARQLAVDGVIEGAVLRDGDRVRINVQLIDGRSDRHLWAESYDRDLRDVLMLQSDVARAVAAEVGATLSSEEHERLTKVRRVNSEAYDAYLRGRFYFGRVNEQDNLRAVTLFERAITLDPSFAQAHAELGLAYLYVFNFFRPNDMGLEERARAAVQRALSLDPDVAEAHIALGRLVWTPAQGYQHGQSIREYRRALALNPTLDEARFQLGQVLTHGGLLDEALVQFAQADSDNIRARDGGVAQVLLYQGKYAEALSVLTRSPADFNPTLVGYQKAWALFALGRSDEALAVLAEYVRNFPRDPAGTFASMQAVIHAARGNRREVDRLIATAAQKNRDSLQYHHTAYNIAVAYALLGKADDALRWLEYAAKDGLPCVPLFEGDPNLETVRRHPRFSRFLEGLREQREELRTLATES